MLSQKFTEHSVRESKGSTNPYINFPDIAKFEFDIPPLEQQKHIAQLFWTADSVIETNRYSVESASTLVDAELEKFLFRDAQWPVAQSCDLLTETPRNGFSPPASDNSMGLPTLSISAIRGGKVITDGSLKYANVSANEVDQFRLRRSDILVVRGNGIRLLCGRAGIVEEFPDGCFYPDLLIRLRFRPELLIPEFAVMQWNESTTHLRLLKRAKSTNGISKINGQDVQSHKLLVPPISSQRRFLIS